MAAILRRLAKALINLHITSDQPNVFLFATPRGGSTWFMELVACQPGFRYCDEPLNIRSEWVRESLGIDQWADLYGPAADARFEGYFAGLTSGAINFRNPNPLKPHYRFLTRRTVFKIIHGGVDRISWFRDTFNGRILYCLRHPIAVSLSRQELPFLPHFLESRYAQFFSSEQVEVAEKVIRTGSHLEQGVLAWCLHNSVPLRDATDDWTVVTYEQAVIDPTAVIDCLCERLELPDPKRIYHQLHVPSQVSVKSDEETRDLLGQGGDGNNRQALVCKWRQKVSAPEVQSAMSLLKVFDIDAYSADSFMPSKKYWIGGHPPDMPLPDKGNAG